MVAAKLPKIELSIYLFVWTATIVFSAYHVYLASELFDLSRVGDDFKESWGGFKKDAVDYEWATWLPLILHSLLPWCALHLAATELTRWLYPKGIPGVHSFITLAFISVHYGVPCAGFALGQVAVHYFILRLGKVILVWLFGVPFLLISCFVLEEIWGHVGTDDQAFTMMIVSTAWLHLHCTSFSLESLTAQNSSKGELFYELLGYCFYFPTYFLGPFIIYTNFSPYMYRPFERWTVRRVKTFVLNMLRFLFWAAITDTSLHFFYIHALKYHLSTVAQLGDWTFYGLGFLMGHFFYMKYVVVYGLFSTVARFDGYDAPPPPKCVARVHLYTEMWRNFDVGFYQFMHRYTYSPLCRGDRQMWRRLLASVVCFSFVYLWHGTQHSVFIWSLLNYLYIYSPLCGGDKQMWRRLLASVVCFSFVYLWHGTQHSVFIWSLLNYLSVSLITLAKTVSRTPAYKKWEKRYLSGASSRRLSALLAAPLFILGPVSSFFFFSGMSSGRAYMRHLFIYGSWRGLLGLLFVAYCACQVSIEARNWEETKSRKPKTN